MWHYRKGHPDFEKIYGKPESLPQTARDAGGGCKPDNAKDKEELIKLEEKIRDIGRDRTKAPAKSKAGAQPPISTIVPSKATYASKEAMDEAAEAVAFGIIESGLPAVVLRKPAFRAMLEKVANAGPEFKPPSSETLRTTLLDKVSAADLPCLPCLVLAVLC